MTDTDTELVVETTGPSYSFDATKYTFVTNARWLEIRERTEPSADPLTSVSYGRRIALFSCHTVISAFSR